METIQILQEWQEKCTHFYNNVVQISKLTQIILLKWEGKLIVKLSSQLKI